MRKTKIICTVGPAVDSDEQIRKLIEGGMNAARFNFSHGSHEEHKARMDRVRRVASEMGVHIPLILDTRGPEIRTKEFKDGAAILKEGTAFTLYADDKAGDEHGVSITYPYLAEEVEPGTSILIDDGLCALTVTAIKGKDVVCRVCNTSRISNHKSINIPNVDIDQPFISEADRKDLLFGIKEDVDFISASFVRTADDVKKMRKLLNVNGGEKIRIIAKIENRSGIENLDKIIEVVDGIMVARGDMGVEVPFKELPVIQKMMIGKCIKAGKIVVTATQMLDSMMKNPRPTRAETTDVANAIYDGTSAIMLSGETAAGLYPVQAVETMAKIAVRAENDIDYIKRFKTRSGVVNPDVTNAISHATCTTAHDLNAAAIITVTKSGKTARMISKYRPACPIVGCSMSKTVCRQLNLSWGVTPLLMEEKDTTDSLFDHAVDSAEKAGVVSQGELVVITAGVPLGISGTTNMMKVNVVGHILASGRGITAKSACASLCVCADAQEAARLFKDGDILVVPRSTNELLPFLKKASGIVTEEDGVNSHAAIVGLSLDIPVIVGAANATRILKSGAVVTIDAIRGVVCSNPQSEA